MKRSNGKRISYGWCNSAGCQVIGYGANSSKTAAFPERLISEIAASAL